MKSTTCPRGIPALLIVMTITCAIGVSCRHEPVVPDYQVSYRDDVSPILIGSCAQVHCHDASGTDGAPLDNYFNVTNNVVKGKPLRSKLYTVLVSHSAKEMMPPASSPQLTDGQIQMIYTWILQGAPDN